MPTPPFSRFSPSLPLVLLGLLLSTLWVAGGASRGDVAGQAVVRGAVVPLLTVMVLFGDRPDFTHGRVVWLLLATIVALPLIQLIPLPPNIWMNLPNRAPFAEAAVASGQSQPWRPWSLSPASTINAAASLLIPVAAMIFAAGIKRAERYHVATALLVLVVAATVIGLLQFSSGRFDNPFINETVGQVSGNFANRNHFALFLALGCVLAPAWAVMNDRKPGWRGAAAFGLVLLFLLTILASGSRAGLVLGLLGLTAGLVLSWRNIRRELRRFPRWALPVLVAGIVGTFALFVSISVLAGRAESIQRIFAVDPGQDMRGRALPTILAMIQAYFPAGTGLGTFDPLFRMHEPFELLKPTYFNHAHNDFLEIVLDAGLLGALVVLAAVLWWAWASVRTWRAGTAEDQTLPRAGSAILLLVLIASAFDYPARTPMIMAVVALAAVWLSTGVSGRDGSTLP